MVRIAHISDLHFGAADEQALQSLQEALAELSPTATVLTGDVTQAGRRREFISAADYLAGIDTPLMVLPGNHDVPVYSLHMRFAAPWRRFRQILNADTDSVMNLPDALIIGLNSARRAGVSRDWSLGRLSVSQIASAEARLREATDGTLRIVALHHPIEAGEGRAGRAVVARSETALRTFLHAGADVILTGHAHISNASIRKNNHDSMVIIAAGTASSTRQRGEAPSFNMLTGNRKRLLVEIYEYGNGRYERARRRAFEKSGKEWTDVAKKRRQARSGASMQD